MLLSGERRNSFEKLEKKKQLINATTHTDSRLFKLIQFFCS